MLWQHDHVDMTGDSCRTETTMTQRCMPGDSCRAEITMTQHGGDKHVTPDCESHGNPLDLTLLAMNFFKSSRTYLIMSWKAGISLSL